MPYVMVPVPEEHAVEVMEHIVRLVARNSVEDWDEETFNRLFLEADESTRSVLSVVARGVLAGRSVEDVNASQSIQLGVREIFGIVREMNDRARDVNRPALVTLQQISEPLPNGRVREKRLLTMTQSVAQFVSIAEQSERESQPHHLGTEAG